MSAFKVAVLVGSLRKGSFTRRLAEALIKLAPPALACEIVEIGALALYDQDLDEGTPPAAWQAFRERMKDFDAVLFTTPEYNRGLPAVLKNAIDVGSRPYGASVWDKKPAAVVSNSPGAIGAFGANHQLRQSLVFLNMPVMQQPEAYVGQAATLVDDERVITNEGTRKFLTGFMTAFAAWVETTAAKA
jgi:chromate reductase